MNFLVTGGAGFIGSHVCAMIKVLSGIEACRNRPQAVENT
jgi:nucleoside-diphosphate-sugar epimerase